MHMRICSTCITELCASHAHHHSLDPLNFTLQACGVLQAQRREVACKKAQQHCHLLATSREALLAEDQRVQ